MGKCVDRRHNRCTTIAYGCLWWVWVLVGILVLLLFAAIVFYMRKRESSKNKEIIIERASTLSNTDSNYSRGKKLKEIELVIGYPIKN
jgi:Ca2+/Na+ antiporter